MKNRTVIGVVCAILAVVLMFAVSPLINKAAAEKVEILRLAKDIPQGRMITEQDVETVTAGGYNLPQSIVKDKAAVIGKYAACDLKKTITCCHRNSLTVPTMQMMYSAPSTAPSRQSVSRLRTLRQDYPANWRMAILSA